MGEIVRFPRLRKIWPQPRRLGWPAVKGSLLAATVAISAAAGYALYDVDASRISFSFGSTFHLCVVAGQQSCVIDGDTIRYRGMTIRLADIDTPETREPKCAAEAALGRRATNRLLELMNAGPFDVVSAGSRDVDRYGRQLRVIERDGRSLGQTLIAEGLARRWDGARRSWCG